MRLTAVTFFATVFAPILVCLATPIAEPAGANDNGLHFPLRRVSVRDYETLPRRDVPIPLTNQGYTYLIDLAIGSPPQKVQLRLDTGSDEVVVLSPIACPKCSIGTYSASLSKTAGMTAGSGIFTAAYGGGAVALGLYHTDKAQLGSATLSKIQLGVADFVYNMPYGIMGIGFGASNKPSGILNTLLNDKIISSNSYSIFLDSIAANTGGIIFGGIDKTKYVGELVYLPIHRKAMAGDIDRLNIEWTYLSDSIHNQKPVILTDPGLSSPVLLDTGTTVSVIPDQNFWQIWNSFGVSGPIKDNFYVNCTMPAGHVTFGFGHGPAVTIDIPYSELAIPSKDPGICFFGLQPQNGSSNLVFGESFLRNAYVDFNFGNGVIGLAQRDWKTNQNHKGGIL